MRGLSWAFLLVLAAATTCLAHDAPLEIAGIRLGTAISSYSAVVDTSKVEVELPERYMATVAVKPMEGFRSGYVTYGNCASPGTVMRIKMNYDNDSKAFYKKLLKALTKRYGEPHQWRGNPFGSLFIWKWALKDPALGDISIILQHYSGDDDSFTKGNSIRIAAGSLLDKEAACYREKHPETKLEAPAKSATKLDLEYFLPN